MESPVAYSAGYRRRRVDLGGRRIIKKQLSIGAVTEINGPPSGVIDPQHRRAVASHTSYSLETNGVVLSPATRNDCHARHQPEYFRESSGALLLDLCTSDELASAAVHSFVEALERARSERPFFGSHYYGLQFREAPDLNIQVEGAAGTGQEWIDVRGIEASGIDPE
jgi:hypothetical protein